MKRVNILKNCFRSRGVLLTGGPGSGKTSLVLNLVENSCFGGEPGEPGGGTLGKLASHLVGYHFCQADNAPTCLVPQFVHSLAAQLSQAPQLAPYYRHLKVKKSSLTAYFHFKSTDKPNCPHTCVPLVLPEKPVSGVRPRSSPPSCPSPLPGSNPATFPLPGGGRALRGGAAPARHWSNHQQLPL